MSTHSQETIRFRRWARTYLRISFLVFPHDRIFAMPNPYARIVKRLEQLQNPARCGNSRSLQVGTKSECYRGSRTVRCLYDGYLNQTTIRNWEFAMDKLGLEPLAKGIVLRLDNGRITRVSAKQGVKLQ